MATRTELDRILGDFFVDGTDELADRVIDAALAQVDTTNQRRPIWVPRRFSPMTLRTRFALAAAVGVLAVGAAVYVIGSGQSPYGAGPTPTTVVTPAPSPSASAAAQSPLFGYWVTGTTTCTRQNAALAKASFTTAQLQSDGWDAATCGAMKAGSRFSLLVTNSHLNVYQDGVLGWSGAYQIVDSQTFKAGENGNLYITYHYAIAGDQLTIDMVEDKLPSPSAGEQLGEDIAQTVIYETAPFTRGT